MAVSCRARVKKGVREGDKDGARRDVLGRLFLEEVFGRGRPLLIGTSRICPQSATLQTLLRILKFISVTLWWTQSYIPFGNT